MKNWHKERKKLEKIIDTAGVVMAYDFIPQDMPVGEFPERLIEYHRLQQHKEVMKKIPSYADIAREAKIDELKRKRGSKK
ncbi:MAG: hypothetical protein ACTSPV_00445 [Candidatus Hodarchaeales archaeon]